MRSYSWIIRDHLWLNDVILILQDWVIIRIKVRKFHVIKARISFVFHFPKDQKKERINVDRGHQHLLKYLFIADWVNISQNWRFMIIIYLFFFLKRPNLLLSEYSSLTARPAIHSKHSFGEATGRGHSKSLQYCTNALFQLGESKSLKLSRSSIL